MICGDKGFRQVTGREESYGLQGIVNVQAFCLNTETEMTSNSSCGYPSHETNKSWNYKL